MRIFIDGKLSDTISLTQSKDLFGSRYLAGMADLLDEASISHEGILSNLGE